MVRILVMGAGLIGGRHARLVADHPGCALVGVVDPDPDCAVPAGVPRYADLSDVDGAADAVIVATPTGLHMRHGIEAARKGLHVLMEKPVAASVDQARQLDDAVRAAEVACLVGHHRRYHPALVHLRDLVASGRIGAPVTATLIWAMRKPDSYFRQNWRSTDGSPVMINLIHDVDMLRFVLGDITGLAGFGSDTQRNGGRLESGAVALRFASGATGTVSFADTTPSPWGFEAGMGENPNIAATGQDMWWITGTRGAVSFPSLRVWTGAADWSQAPQVDETGPAERTVPLQAQLQHFLDVVRDGAPPRIGIADARESLRVTTEIEALLGQEVGLEEASMAMPSRHLERNET